MAALKLKTLEEHCGMVEKMGRLSFCFASRRLKERTNFLHFSPQEWQDDLPSRSSGMPSGVLIVCWRTCAVI